MNCLQVMVERSSLTAFAGAVDSMSVAAFETVVFMMISIGARHLKKGALARHAQMLENRASKFAGHCRKRNLNTCASTARFEFNCP
jgi:hypothetical protein